MVRREKTKPEVLHRHEARGRLLGELGKEPGLRLFELCDRLGLSRGTARYHLRLLERSGVIQSLADQGRHHFFPPDATPDDIRRLTVLRRQRMPELLAAIMSQPGIVQRDLLRQIGMHRKVFRTYVRILLEQGLVSEKRDRGACTYRPTALLLEVLDRWAPPVPALPVAPPALRLPRQGGRP